MPVFPSVITLQPETRQHITQNPPLPLPSPSGGFHSGFCRRDVAPHSATGGTETRVANHTGRSATSKNKNKTNEDSAADMPTSIRTDRQRQTNRLHSFPKLCLTSWNQVFPLPSPYLSPLPLPSPAPVTFLTCAVLTPVPSFPPFTFFLPFQKQFSFLNTTCVLLRSLDACVTPPM